MSQHKCPTHLVHPLGKFHKKKGGRPRKYPELDSCRGGGVRIGSDGYAYEIASDHPLSNYKAGIPQHRLVAECMLGRLLKKGEIVHHKNKIKLDNSPENLEVCGNDAAHKKKHYYQMINSHAIKHSVRQIREALKGRTIRNAALFLGCSVSFLEKNYKHLPEYDERLAKLTKKDLRKKIEFFAKDPTCRQSDAAKILNVCTGSIQKHCKTCGIKWVVSDKWKPSHRKTTKNDDPVTA